MKWREVGRDRERDGVRLKEIEGERKRKIV